MAYQPRQKLTDRQKESVFLRFNGRCSRCGKLGESKWVINSPRRRKFMSFFLVNMEIHHIEKYSQGGSKVIENLELLCVDCHKKEHSRCHEAG